jgi:hypothetical protein
MSGYGSVEADQRLRQEKNASSNVSRGSRATGNEDESSHYSAFQYVSENRVLTPVSRFRVIQTGGKLAGSMSAAMKPRGVRPAVTPYIRVTHGR